MSPVFGVWLFDEQPGSWALKLTNLGAIDVVVTTTASVDDAQLRVTGTSSDAPGPAWGVLKVTAIAGGVRAAP